MKSLINIGLLLISLLPHACWAGLHLVTQDKPPFNYLAPDTDQTIGLAVDILSEAASRAHVEIASIKLYPMVRSIIMAQGQDDTCVFPVVRTGAREHLFKWVGPFAQNVWVFYARDDFKGRIASLEDARQLRIGSDPHSAKTTYLKSQGFNRMDVLAEDDLNARKLSAGRFDLWLVGLYDGKIFADQAGITNIKPVFQVKDVDYFMACNPKVPAASIAALNGAIKSMQTDRSAQRIVDRYRTLFANTNWAAAGDRR